MNKKLDASKALRRLIHLRTKHPDGDNLGGIVLQNARSFVALLQVNDFEPDGIVVLPKKWLKSIRDGKVEACANEVIRFTGALGGGATAEWPSDFASLQHILAYLKERDIWPVVEIIYRGGSALYLGPVTDVSGKAMLINCYSAAGEWEKEYELDFGEIFKIEIESRYARAFNAYMKGRHPPPPRRG